MSATTSIDLGDVEGLNALISEEFGPWGDETEVSQDLINRFADLSGDYQWIHTDIERAKAESPFGATIAHGFLLLSLLPRLRRSSIEITGYKSALNYGSDKLRFLAPVPAGSRIHARSRLAAVEKRSAGTLVTTEVEVAVVQADKPCLLYRMQVLYRG